MYCNKCGNQLDFDAAFCNICGTPVERDDQTSDLSVEESIALADKLKTRYAQLEKLEREVADNEKRIAGPLNLNYRQFSFFRFYWKFLVFAVISFYVMLIIMVATDFNGIVTFLTIAAPLGFIITGIFLAIKRRNEENYAISLGNEEVRQQRKKLEEKTSELKKTLNARRKDITEFNDIVPAQFRKSSSMAQVKALLVAGKVSNLMEAFRLLK